MKTLNQGVYFHVLTCFRLRFSKLIFLERAGLATRNNDMCHTSPVFHATPHFIAGTKKVACSRHPITKSKETASNLLGKL